jgi:AI-2 transport protein TqsA
MDRARARVHGSDMADVSKPPSGEGNALIGGSTRDSLERLRAGTAQTALLGVLTAIAVAFTLRLAAGVLLPFVLALFLAYLLAPIMSALAKRGVPERLTLPVAMLALVSLVIPLEMVVMRTVEQITERMPFYTARAEELTQSLADSLGAHGRTLSVATWADDISGALGQLAVDLFGSVITFVGNLVLVITCTVFMLLGRRSVEKNVERAFDPARVRELREIFEQANAQVQRYLVTKVVLSLVTGFLMYVVLALFEVDFASFWGLLGFLLNFIPTLGSAVAAVLPITVALLQFEGREIDALWVAACLIGIQQIIGNFIEPKVQGDRLNLSPIVVLFALVLFGWLWGFWGMVLSVPLMAILKTIFEHTRSLRPVAIMMEK